MQDQQVDLVSKRGDQRHRGMGDGALVIKTHLDAVQSDPPVIC
jgi:hypothetical protein